MKKSTIKKLVLLILSVLMLGSFTGCSAGSTLETTITINKDLSGVRTMDVIIDDSVFSEYFNGTVEDLSALIESKCPAELTWSYSDSAGSKTYSFELAFSSVADYESKAQTLTGNTGDILVLNAPENVWATGFYLEEDFSSTDLMNWLKEAVVEAGLVSSSNSSYILSTGNTTVVFGDQTYSASSYAYINEISYVKLNGFEVYTTLKGSDLFDRSIVLSIPEDSMLSNGEEIKSFVAEMIPSGATANWTEDENSTHYYTVEKKDMAAAELDAFMKGYFGTENTTFSVSESDDYASSPFSFKYYVNDCIDFSNYLLGSSGYYPSLKYYIKAENGYSSSYYSESELEDFVLYTTDTIYSASPENYSVPLIKSFNASALEINSKVSMLGNFERTFIFTFDKVPSEEELALIEQKINNLLKEAYETETAQETVSVPTDVSTEDTDTTETTAAADTGKDNINYTKEYGLKLKDKVSKDVFTYTIKQSGSKEEIQRSNLALFGRAGKMEYASDFSIFKLKYEVGYCEDLYLNSFITSKTSDYVVTHTVTLPLFSSITYPHDTTAVSGREITTQTYSGYLSTIITGERTNLWSIAFYLLIVAAIVLTLIVLNKAGVFDKTKANLAANAQAKLQAQAAQSAETQAAQSAEAPAPAPAPAPAVRFCTNCGAKADADAIICTECGQKLEK